MYLTWNEWHYDKSMGLMWPTTRYWVTRDSTLYEENPLSRPKNNAETRREALKDEQADATQEERELAGSTPPSGSGRVWNQWNDEEAARIQEVAEAKDQDHVGGTTTPDSATGTPDVAHPVKH